MERENKRTKRVEDMLALLRTVPRDIWKYILCSYSDVCLQDIQNACIALGAEDSICGGKNNVWDMIFKRQYGVDMWRTVTEMWLNTDRLDMNSILAYRATLALSDVTFKGNVVEIRLDELYGGIHLQFDIDNEELKKLLFVSVNGAALFVKPEGFIANTPLGIIVQFYDLNKPRVTKFLFYSYLRMLVRNIQIYVPRGIEPNVFCGQCFERAATHVCASCGDEGYCGETCARKAWNGHHHYGCSK